MIRVNHHKLKRHKRIICPCYLSMSVSKIIPVASPLIDDEDISEVTKVLKSSWVSSLGEEVVKFEKLFSTFCETKYGVSTNSGTTSLHLALCALGIKPGDEVIIPDFTMIACPNAVSYTGAKPVLVDADEETWCINVDKIEEKITKKTRAIMPVHIYGHPSEMDSIIKIAKEHNLYILEDAAEAHGALYKGKKVGSLGDIGSFSFYANKIITTGEGGMCVTNNNQLSETMSWLRAHAFGRGGKHFWHETIGFGYRMSSLQASLGVSQMAKITSFVDKRIKNAKLYNDLLSSLSDNGLLTLPPSDSHVKNVYWMYSVLLSSKINRKKVMDYLEKKGIETRTFFYPVHSQPAYSDQFLGQSFPTSDKLSLTGINLPSGNTLTEEEIHTVANELIQAINFI